MYVSGCKLHLVLCAVCCCTELLSQLSNVRSRTAAVRNVSAQLQQLELQLQSTRSVPYIALGRSFAFVKLDPATARSIPRAGRHTRQSNLALVLMSVFCVMTFFDLLMHICFFVVLGFFSRMLSNWLRRTYLKLPIFVLSGM